MTEPLREDPGTRLQRALALHMSGRTRQAIPLYETVIAHDPLRADALQLLGMALTQIGDPARGAVLMSRSLAIDPSPGVVHANLGHAQLALGEPQAALESYERCIEREGGYAPAHNGRGSALVELGRGEEGLRSFERALQLAPDFADAIANRAAALFKLRRYPEALDVYGRALALRPGDPRALVGRALTCIQLWRHAEALADVERARALQPGIVNGPHARCAALIGLGRAKEALAVLDAEPERGERDAELVLLRGNALRQLGRPYEALAAYQRALALKPDFAEALAAIAMLQTADKRLDEAAVTCARLLEVAPDGDFNRGVALHASLHVLDWSGYAVAAGKIIAGLEAGSRTDLPFTFLSISDDPQLQRRCAEAYCSVRPPAGSRLYRTAGAPHERIRVAYVSADFLEHPISYLTAGLIETHDRARVETIAISLRTDRASPTARRLRAAFERFFDVSSAGDEQIARLMSELGVDIAVDLMGYTAEERPGILLRRPAPIQVNYLGLPATMGSRHIDYILADEFVIPPQQAAHYSECVAYLPECFQVNDSRRVAPAGAATRAEHGLPREAFVFCSFHASVKLNPPLFDVWARLLQAVPDSVLWLIANTAAAADNLRREAGQRGVDPRRLVFAARESYPRHLARLALADLCLDTWPFNGGATSSDALWCGVPIVTRAGRSLSSRMSGSLLRTLGLPELVSDNWDDYYRIAHRLAADREALRAVRARLARGRTESSLFDTARVRRYIEAAYATMWERHRRGEPPASFRVSP